MNVVFPAGQVKAMLGEEPTPDSLFYKVLPSYFYGGECDISDTKNADRDPHTLFERHLPPQSFKLITSPHQPYRGAPSIEFDVQTLAGDTFRIHCLRPEEERDLHDKDFVDMSVGDFNTFLSGHSSFSVPVQVYNRGQVTKSDSDHQGGVDDPETQTCHYEAGAAQ